MSTSQIETIWGKWESMSEQDQVVISRWAFTTVVTLFIFLVAHTGALIWWASRVNSIIEIHALELNELKVYQRGDVQRALSRIDRLEVQVESLKHAIP